MIRYYFLNTEQVFKNDNCEVVFLGGHFLFTCSGTFATSFSYNAQRRRQTDGRTDRQHYDANSRSHCVQYDRL